MAQGTIKWFDAEKGSGSIAQDVDGPDVLVHLSQSDLESFGNLEAGQVVMFEIRQGPRGPEALGVRPI